MPSPSSTPSADSSSRPPSAQPTLTSVDPGPAAPRQACDTCKARKIRCERSNTSISPTGGSQRCDACKKHGFPCTVDHKAKKRGPRPSVTGRQLPGRNRERPLRPRHAQTAMDGNGAVAETIGDRPTGGSAGRGREDGVALASTLRDAHALSVFPGFGIGLPLLDAASPAAVNPDPNPLEALIPRAVLDHAVNTYFKYLFGLVPVVHRPTFMSDFTARREELPGQEEWTALVFGIVGVSFSQVPWDFATMSKSDIRDMVQKCYDRVKEFVFEDFTTPTTTRCVLLYLAAIMATRLGHRGVREICLGANWALIFKMRIHEESSYVGIGAIEAEIRRRIFWLALGFDKSAHAVHGTAPHTTREHCATVGLPSAIDDEFLTDDGYASMSAGATTSILSGFRYVSRLYGLFGHILDMRRLDQHHTPSGDTLKMRLLEVEELFEQMANLMAGCPEELRLSEHGHGVSSALDWAEQSYEDIRLLFEHPNSRSMVADSFLVQQANIYTTMHMTRLLTLRYRADLRTLRAREVHHQLGGVGFFTTSANLATTATREEPLLDEEADRTAAELLDLLKTIPLQVLAVNGDAVVNKVRFVAVTQLEALERLTNQANATSPSSERDTRRLQVAQDHLFNFLRILTEIETLFSFTNEPLQTS